MSREFFKKNKWMMIPLLGLVYMLLINQSFRLLSEKSDIAVLVGVLIIFILLFSLQFMKKLFLVALVALSLGACTRIDAGYDGILIKQYGSDKGVQDVNLVTGRVFYNPFTEDVEQMPTFVQTYDFPAFTVNAKDGSAFEVDPTMSFGIVQGETPRIFKKYRKDLHTITSTAIYNHIKDAFRIEMNKYSTDEIVSNREKFETEVQNSIQKVLEREGFYFEQLTSGLKYPKTIVDAVNAKNKSIQEAMKVDNDLKVAEAQARIDIVKAEAEKKANELKQQSLTPLLVQQQFIEKWDGKTPLYGNAPVIFKSVN